MITIPILDLTLCHYNNQIWLEEFTLGTACRPWHAQSRTRLKHTVSHWVMFVMFPSFSMFCFLFFYISLIRFCSCILERMDLQTMFDIVAKRTDNWYSASDNLTNSSLYMDFLTRHPYLSYTYLSVLGVLTVLGNIGNVMVNIVLARRKHYSVIIRKYQQQTATMSRENKTNKVDKGGWYAIFEPSNIIGGVTRCSGNGTICKC